MPRLSFLLDLTPRETLRLLRGRTPWLKARPAWTAEELLASPKHTRGIRFAELLLRQEAEARQALPWPPIGFDGRRVVEVGCGPLAGFGPLAVFCGAARFESAEPEWDAALFFSEPVAHKYLRVLHADLVALYGPRMDFSAFRKAIEERLVVHTCGFEKAPIAPGVDVVLSQSVLEHVFPLAATIEKLAAIQSPETRVLHLVDFGNHYPTMDPFAGLYEQEPERYIARRGKAINLLRAPDISELFRAHGIPAARVPTRFIPGLYRGALHPWWRSRYDDQALFTQLALYAGPDLR